MKLALVLVTGTCLLLSGCSSKHFPEKPADLVRVTLMMDERGHVHEEPIVLEGTDSDGIKELIGLLNAGTPNKDHGCTSPGSLAILYRNGSEVKVGILPGHDKEFYEFRQHGANYRVPRGSFLQVLKKSGIDTTSLPAPPSDKES